MYLGWPDRDKEFRICSGRPDTQHSVLYHVEAIKELRMVLYHVEACTYSVLYHVEAIKELRMHSVSCIEARSSGCTHSVLYHVEARSSGYAQFA